MTSSDPFANAESAHTTVYDLAPLAVLAIRGPDAATFLQGQLSNDVRRLAAGTWQATTYNSPKGRVLANFLLWPHEDGFRALVPASIADALRKRLAMFVLRSKVTIAAEPEPRRRGLAGPGAEQALAAGFDAAPGPHQVVTSGRNEVLGLPGGRFVALLAAGATGVAALDAAGDLAPYEAWEWLAIRAGEPLVTAPTQDAFVLQSANLDALAAVSFDKGCYTGQEIVARTQYLGRLKERLFGYHVDRAEVPPGTKLYSPVFGDQACGTVANAAPAPTGGTDLLAVVQIAAAEGAVRLGSPDGPLLAPFALPYAVPDAAPRRRA